MFRQEKKLIDSTDNKMTPNPRIPKPYNVHTPNLVVILTFPILQLSSTVIVCCSLISAMRKELYDVH